MHAARKIVKKSVFFFWSSLQLKEEYQAVNVSVKLESLRSEVSTLGSSWKFKTF